MTSKSFVVDNKTTRAILAAHNTILQQETGPVAKALDVLALAKKRVVGLVSGAQRYENSSKTFSVTNASSKFCECAFIEDLSALLASEISDDFSEGVMDALIYDVDLYHPTKPFKVAFCMVIAEAGLTWTTTESDSTSPWAVLATAIDKDFIAAILPPVKSRMVLDNGSVAFKAGCRLNMTKVAKKYFQLASEMEIEADTPPSILLGAIAYLPDDGSTLTLYYQKEAVSHTRPRRIVQ